MKKTTLILTVAILIALVFTGCMKLSTANLADILPQAKTEYVQCGDYEVIANRMLVGYDSADALNELAAKIDAQILLTIPEIKAAALRIPGDVEETINKLSAKNIAGIRYIEPSYKRELITPDVEEDITLSTSRDTNDPFYDFLWGLKKINTEAAWDMGYTGAGVVVAVCDGGSDSSHPDLAGQYVDGRLITAATDLSIPAGTSIPYGSHGTHVSGTIAAVKDNNIGIAGVAPDSKIMPIPVFASDFIGDAYVAAGWAWAVNHGAKVLQNSWGGPGYSYTLKAGIDYALENGAVVVISTGNTHINENWGFPNSAPGVIGVGASTVNDIVTEFSSRGDSVSIVAPGESILSTIGMDDAAVLQDGQHYSYYNGTSMASPHVSAVAALLYQKYPDATPYQIRKLLEDGAKGDIAMFGEASSRAADYNENSGYGRLDALGSVSLDLPAGGAGGNLTLTVTDSTGKFAVGGVSVTLKRTDKPSYYAKTDANGVCKFRAIDPDTYELYVGGPDFAEIGSVVNRIAEENTYTNKNFVVGEDTTLSLALSSTFAAELVMPSAVAEYTAKMVDTLGNEFQAQVAGPGDVVNFTAPNSTLDIQYYLSVEASPALAPGAAILTEDFESQDFSNAAWSWVPGGDVVPTVTNTEASSGTYSMQFGAITDSESSDLAGAFNVPLGASYWLSFDVKVSSEEGYDFVYVNVDGSRIFSGSGEMDWQKVTTQVTSGAHTISFEYVKDTNTLGGQDTGWIDNIQIVAIPLDFADNVVTGTVNLNGYTIPVEQNLYLGSYVDEFELEDVPWTLF
ncbi:MAG TPA: S8 family serine peptidase [Thermotogota bacterium]|nr:S8 family serine peptidase [Thermotogota bacterium]HPJ89148.1 S8 family serine peptidase [Thermotogota bacterium]HPR97386.1 S8 family serine peptidase [Thermotogota bacterium]